MAEHLTYSGLVVRKSATERRFRPQMAKLRREAVAEENFREATVNDIHRLLKARTRRSHLIETYVETQLAPALKPGDIVVLDNLPAHKSAAAEKAIRAKDAWLLFLPPYSPDLNPIEMAFAMLKALLRAHAVTERNATKLSSGYGVFRW